MLCSIACPALGICPIVGWWTLGSKQLSIAKTSTRACCRRTASYSETQTQRIYEPPRRLFTWSLTEVRRRSAVYNRSLVHGPLQLSIDDSAYDSIKLHGYTLHELIGFLPTDIQESTAPFIHPLLRNGIEDVNQINAAVCYLRAQLELLANPQCLFLKANVDKARDLWSKAIRVNAPLVREANKLLYARDQDNLKVEGTPHVVYKKDASGHRLPAKAFNMHLFQNKVTSKVHGWVSDGAIISNVPYIDLCGKLWVKENGNWITMDGDWGPCSSDITPEGLFKSGSIFSESEPVWLKPWRAQLPQVLGRFKYTSIVNSGCFWDG